MTTIFLVISLQGQGLNGSEALDIRNAIEEQIEENTDANIVGSGGYVDGSEVDLVIETTDFKNTVEFIKGLMIHAELENNYKITTTD